MDTAARGTLIDSRVSTRRDRVAIILDTHVDGDELSVETGMSIEDGFVLLGQLTNALHGAVSNRESLLNATVAGMGRQLAEAGR